MGVKDLWNIISPLNDQVPLWSFKGEAIAIDLSVWICECQGWQSGDFLKPHIRNLFFRTKALLEAGIMPVFCIEGKAPELKYATINARLRSQGKGVSCASNRKGSRPNLRGKLNECVRVLDVLGVPWVQAKGEAEALAAQLNRSGLVSAVVSQDADTFLYGAQKVLRNFTVDQLSPRAEAVSSLDIEQKLGLSRTDLIALGLLLGCDFYPGVPGVGIEKALKLIQSPGWKGNALQRLSAWLASPLPSLPVAPSVPHCGVCGHPGSKRGHKDSGCGMCGSSVGCEVKTPDTLCTCVWHENYRSQETLRLELWIRERAPLDFPPLNVIDEFLSPEDSRAPLPRGFQWKRPALEPAIIKERRLGGVACVELTWVFGGSVRSTVERLEHVHGAWPELVEEWRQAKEAKKKEKKKGRTKKKKENGGERMEEENGETGVKCHWVARAKGGRKRVLPPMEGVEEILRPVEEGVKDGSRVPEQSLSSLLTDSWSEAIGQSWQTPPAASEGAVPPKGFQQEDEDDRASVSSASSQVEDVEWRREMDDRVVMRDVDCWRQRTLRHSQDMFTSLLASPDDTDDDMGATAGTGGEEGGEHDDSVMEDLDVSELVDELLGVSIHEEDCLRPTRGRRQRPGGPIRPDFRLTSTPIRPDFRGLLASAPGRGGKLQKRKSTEDKQQKGVCTLPPRSPLGDSLKLSPSSQAPQRKKPATRVSRGRGTSLLFGPRPPGTLDPLECSLLESELMLPLSQRLQNRWYQV
ncbi:unnamed protein product [Cyprideis torosa]|uniref:Uncharacterized protein n=1 Tax=Cyprideis torosa TaxID=163714 RepID=A0A7R8W7J2_9CRUS|nr:unnamed protein product [Cyprideis torosa]CAG0886380.1 unnamed protein product [Cyprideis torosa]